LERAGSDALSSLLCQNRVFASPSVQAAIDPNRKFDLPPLGANVRQCQTPEPMDVIRRHACTESLVRLRQQYLNSIEVPLAKSLPGQFSRMP